MGRPGETGGLLLLGGKGGVGKTTCSAALAAYMAAAGRRTLLLTTDQTPSLGDVLGVPLTPEPREVERNLFALEMSQQAVTARWKALYGPDFSEVLGRLVDLPALDGETRHQLLDYIGSAPSLLEETMLDHLREMVEGGGWEQVVWDTAPAGETLALLSMPRALRKHLSAGARFYQRLDLVGKLSGRRTVAGIMEEWVERSERLEAFLSSRAAFLLVAQPEAMVVSQTRRVLASLRSAGMTVAGMIVNRVHAQEEEWGRAQAGQRAALRDLAREARLPLALLPARPGGWQGLPALREAGALLAEPLRWGQA